MLLALGVSLAYWHSSYSRTPSALADLHSRTFEVSYSWDDGVREYRIIDPKTGLPEKDMRIIGMVRGEAEEIVSRMLINLQLRKAKGTFTVKIIGMEEPYVVELGEWREPIDSDFTSLMSAAKAGEYEAVRRLLGEGADIEATDQQGRTALMFAAEGCDARIVKALLAAGADPNKTGPRGWTALFVATVIGRMECVQALVAAGANVNVRDEEGKTPLGYAKERKQQQISAILRGARARE